MSKPKTVFRSVILTFAIRYAIVVLIYFQYDTKSFMAKLRRFFAFFIFLAFLGSVFADIKICDDDFSGSSDSITQFELNQALDDAADQPFHILNSSSRGLKKSFKCSKKQQLTHFDYLLYNIFSIKKKNETRFIKHTKTSVPRFSKYLEHIKTKSTLF